MRRPRRTTSSIHNMRIFRRKSMPIWIMTRMCFVERRYCCLVTTQSGVTSPSSLLRTLNYWDWINSSPPVMHQRARSTRCHTSQRSLRHHSHISTTTRARRMARYSSLNMIQRATIVMWQVTTESILMTWNGSIWKVMEISGVRRFGNCETKQILL